MPMINREMRRTRDMLRRQRDWRPGHLLIPDREIEAAAHCDHTMGPEEIVSAVDRAIMKVMKQPT